MSQLTTERMTDSYSMMVKLSATPTLFSQDLNGCDTFIQIKISFLILFSFFAIDYVKITK